MKYTVDEPITEDGYMFADVRTEDETFVGRIVRVMPSDTWRPDEALMGAVGAQTWASLDDARTFLEGVTT